MQEGSSGKNQRGAGEGRLGLSDESVEASTRRGAGRLGSSLQGARQLWGKVAAGRREHA